MKPRKKKPDNSTFSNILEKDKLDEMRLRKVEEKQQRQDLKRKQKAEMKNNKKTKMKTESKNLHQLSVGSQWMKMTLVNHSLWMNLSTYAVSIFDISEKVEFNSVLGLNLVADFCE